MLFPDVIHPSWEEFITEDIIKEIQIVEDRIGDDYNPKDPKLILRFLTVDLNQVKVICLGQDVYPAEGVATGRSFEVGGLKNWNTPFRQVSLKNIVRLVHKNYSGINNYKEIKSFNEIRKQIQNQEFMIKQPDIWFDSLESQGVLFLNKSFTCKIGKSDSHNHIWEKFSHSVLKYISQKKPKIIWFLWGKGAISTKKVLCEGIILQSRHPMMCSEKYEDDFLKFQGIEATMDNINWLG